MLLPILVIAGCGYFLRRKIEIDLTSINRVSIYLLSPALIFTSLTRVQIDSSGAVQIGGFVVGFAIIIGLLTWLSSKLFRFDQPATTAMLLCTIFMNAGNYGLPVARFAFGEEGFQRAVVFFVCQAILAQTTAIYIAASGQGSQRQALKRLFQMPQIYAVLAALGLRFAGVPLESVALGVFHHLFRGVALLSEATVPVLLVILGMQLADKFSFNEKWDVWYAATLRLLVSAPIAYGLARLLQLDDLNLRLAVILACMPTAVNMTILAIEFNVRPRFVSSVVTISTVLSVVTLTGLLLWLGTG